jgi:glycosyltransferase involved in cell wall biosynthesis
VVEGVWRVYALGVCYSRGRMEAVTVVIPTRNRPDLLAVTLRSVLGQRDVNLQVIVVDDASTLDIAGATSGFSDPRVRIVRQPVTTGVSAARNRGVSETTTEWVAFCDDDDLWSPDKLRRQLAAVESPRRDWVYAGCVMVNAGLQIQGGAAPLAPEVMVEELRRYNAVPAGASNVVVRTAVLERIGAFDEHLTHVPDWDLWLRLAQHGVPACVNEPLVAYRIHGGNASFRTAEMLAELYDLEGRHQLTKTRTRFHRHLAYLCLRSGRRREALGHFMRALVRFREGYSRQDFATDGRMLRDHTVEIVRRRFGLPPGRWAARRLRTARERDPNAAWKAQAQAWLLALRC